VKSLICLLLIPCCLNAQNDSAISYAGVVKADSLSHLLLYGRALTWLSGNYIDVGFEVRERDKDVAHLGGIGHCASELDKEALRMVFKSVSYYTFNFDIWIIDGKYRYVFSDIYSRYYGLLTEKVKCPVKYTPGKRSENDKFWLEEKKAFDRQIQLIIASLKYNMNQKRSE
jgi:hypothetical protein